MQKLAEVEEAKALMTEALSWSVIKWLAEKKRVRKTADKANNLVWAMQEELRGTWSEELISAYDALAAGTSDRQRAKQDTSAIDPEIKRLAKAVKQADDEAYAAHLDAEETFDKADKILSTAKAREGCRKAILSWELYEKAILKSEACASQNRARNESRQVPQE
jgi:predicted ribosome quality control (RQC) complex YloA/Tae2 family protein